MLTLTRWMMAPALLTGWLVFAGPASAQKTPVTVQDDAGFFSADAIAKANREIARIKNQFKKDLVIETIKESPSRPDDVSKDPKSESYKKFFDNWAVQRAKNHHINGVGVFLLKNPEILRVVEDSNTQGRLFTHEDGDVLRSRMIAKLKTKDFDGALIAAVSFVNDTMARHQQVAAPANPNTPAKTNPAAPAPQQAEIPWLKYILIGLAVLFVLWIVMAVIRGLSGAGGGGGGGYAPGYGGGGGGGGFMTGFLGGLFGAAAGMWMYNSFFGGHSSSAWGSSPNSDPTGGEAADPGAGADYGVSGGEYGADAGGKPDPDWGAGGGGDAGDAGGGGGDWGGGGGGGDWGGGGGGGDFGGGGGGGDW